VASDGESMADSLSATTDRIMELVQRGVLPATGPERGSGSACYMGLDLPHEAPVLTVEQIGSILGVDGLLGSAVVCPVDELPADYIRGSVHQPEMRGQTDGQ
jgi:hypothetical protein